MTVGSLEVAVMLNSSDMCAESELDKAVFDFADAYARLWACARKYPSEFPQTIIGCGSIAEYYSVMYLRQKHEGAVISYTGPNTRGIDIEVLASNSQAIRYQIKSVSPFNKSRRLNALVRGFDALIVLELDDRFFPSQAFLFEDSSLLFRAGQGRILTVPDRSSSRRSGSKIFTRAKDILDEFLRCLE